MTVSIIQSARATMEAYIAVLGARGAYGEYLAPEIVVQMPAEGIEVKGGEAAEHFIREFHQKSFDAHPTLTSLVVEGDHAAAEFIFEGTHTGEFAGIPATGKKVHVPYTAFYDLHDGKITGLRLYGFGALIQQLQA